MPAERPSRARALASRAYWNLRLFGLPRPLADLWLIVVTVLVVVALSGQDSKIDRQREGRRIAIQALCGVQQGTIDAGRDQLLRYGLHQQADRYARIVARAVEQVADVPHLLDTPGGKLHCDRLVRAGHADK